MSKIIVACFFLGHGVHSTNAQYTEIVIHRSGPKCMHYVDTSYILMQYYRSGHTPI